MFSPSEDRCFQLLKEYGTPDRVIAHCKEVARVSVLLAKALKRQGYTIDINLLKAAALLHDIARVSDLHEEVGADYLRNIGYSDVAKLVAGHTKYKDFNQIEYIDEMDILCISDRTVKEDQYVGVDERMEYIKAKAIYMGRMEFVHKIDIGKEELKKYIYKIEQVIGTNLDDLMRGTYEQNR